MLQKLLRSLNDENNTVTSEKERIKMKVKEVVEKIHDIESTQKLLNEAMKKEKDGTITILYSLAEDIDEKLDSLVELWGMRELK